MKSRNWSPVIRGLHWLTALLVVVCIAAVWGHEAFEKVDPRRAQLMQLHFLLGGGIGLITLLRLLTRFSLPAPEHAMPPLIAKLAKLGHAGLYLLLLVLPALGYVAVSGKGAPIDLLGLLEIPPLAVDKDLAHTVKEVHEVLANTLIALVVVHLLAVVFHFKLLHDEVLQSMLGRAREND